jgi:CheY-like chemotaxis protein
MKILLVEDEEPKQRHIARLVEDTVTHLHLDIAKSVRGALAHLRATPPDLVILDMSLPTFDIGVDEGGGRPQGFGGLEVMRNMELEEISCPVVVITGYEAFSKAGGQVSLDGLAEELSADHPGIFRGIIHYNSAYGDWRTRLQAFLIAASERAAK